MASYAPCSVTRSAADNGIALRQPVEWEAESRELLSRHDASHRRALIALAAFCPTGIFALFYSIKASSYDSGGPGDVETEAYAAAQRAERCTRWSYRIGVLLFVVIAALLIAGIVIVIAELIDTAHGARSF